MTPPNDKRPFPFESKQIIDPAVLAQLQQDVSEAGYCELLALFLTQGEERVAMIGRAIADGDFATLASEIHSFKSESATFGAIPLAELTGHINALCNQGDKNQALATAQGIKAVWSLVRQALET